MHARRLAVAVCFGLAVTGADGQDGADFTARSDLVVLHVTATGSRGEYIRGLSKGRFLVLDEGRPQVVDFFREEDTPATVGLVIDSSGSMFANQERTAAAASALATASHPGDRFFAVVFNERVTNVMPAGTPFTQDPKVLREALARGLGARGRTALHDAVLAGLDEVERGDQARQVLIVISDGGDNSSDATLEQTLRRAEASNAVIHTIALADPLMREQDPTLLRRLAEATGGLSFEPRDHRHVERALDRIATDIRNSYTLAYAPPPAARSGEWRPVQVEAFTADGRRLDVRTRTGYIASSGRALAPGGRR